MPMAKGHMKRCLASQIIREIKVKTAYTIHGVLTLLI